MDESEGPSRMRGRQVLAAAAALGVLMVPACGVDETGPAREVLLVAAKTADADAAGNGRFWRVRTFSVTPRLVGTPPDTYRLDTQAVTESWLSTDGREPDWDGYRYIDTRPVTPADEVAWRRDGGPTANTEAAGALTKREPQTQVVPGFTAQQLRDLPSDPAALRALLAQAPTNRDLTPQHWGTSMESLVFNRTVMLLTSTPLTPKVRATALRLLADLSGVRRTDPVTDALGRNGVGITLVTAGAVSDVRQLVIDPANGRLLGSTDTVAEGHTAILSAEWTDQEPTVPRALR